MEGGWDGQVGVEWVQVFVEWLFDEQFEDEECFLVGDEGLGVILDIVDQEG